MHTHSHAGNSPVDVRVRKYVKILRIVTPFLIHDPHRPHLYPLDESLITSGFALRATNQESLGTPCLTRCRHWYSLGVDEKLLLGSQLCLVECYRVKTWLDVLQRASAGSSLRHDQYTLCSTRKEVLQRTFGVFLGTMPVREAPFL